MLIFSRLVIFSVITDGAVKYLYIFVVSFFITFRRREPLVCFGGRR